MKKTENLKIETENTTLKIKNEIENSNKKRKWGAVATRVGCVGPVRGVAWAARVSRPASRTPHTARLDAR